MAKTRISAFISQTTKALVESYVEARGVETGHLIEEALLHYLRAVRDLPAHLIVSSRLTLSKQAFDGVATLVERPRRPTKALRELMSTKRARSRR
jgi:hypothetical protein